MEKTDFENAIEIEGADTIEETFAKAQNSGHNTIIDINRSTWNKNYQKKMIEKLHDNEKMVNELRELGICYNTEYFKKATGQSASGSNNEANIVLKSSQSELADLRTDFKDDDI